MTVGTFSKGKLQTKESVVGLVDLDLDLIKIGKNTTDNLLPKNDIQNAMN